MDRRIDAALVVGGDYHDFDYARLQLLTLLGGDDRIRTTVWNDFEDHDAITAAEILVTYTCNVRPSRSAQEAIRRWVEAGGRWLALHGTNTAFDAPQKLGAGVFRTPRCFPTWTDTLGSQFLSHPAPGAYTVTVSPGAESDPLVSGIGPFDADDELYLSELHPEIEPLLETRWTGTTVGFEEAEWPDDDPRPVFYRRRLGRGTVLYLTLGHCRSPWDMAAPPFNGMRWPTTDRGSWEVPEYHELLRRSLGWATADALGEDA